MMSSIVAARTVSDLGSRARSRPSAALLASYRGTRAPEEREALVERYTPLAASLARRYHQGSERDDIMQIAYVGLLKAIDRYDPERGIAFSTFAVPTILGEIKRYFRDLGWTVRTPRDVQELAQRAERVTDALTGELGRTPTVLEVAERCDATPEQVVEARASATAHYTVSLDQPLGAERDESIVDRLTTEDPGYARVDDRLDMDRLLDRLPERERAIVLLRFRDELHQREIGKRLGLSQMQVSRLLTKALATLKDDEARSAASGR